MSNKEIRIKAVLDNADFDSQIQKLEQKMSRLQKATGQLDPQSKAGQYAARTYEDFRKETISDVQRKYDVNERSLERLNRALDDQKRKYQEIQDLKRRGLQYDQEQEKVLNNRIQKLEQASRNRVMALGEQQAMMDKYGQPVGGGQPGQQGAWGQMFGGGIGGFSRLLTALAGSAILQGGLNVASTAYEEFGVTRPRKIQQYRGQALRGAGREMEEMAEGRGSERYAWSQERHDAFRMAMLERQRQSNLDLLRGAGGSAIGGLAGAGAGAWLGSKGGAALGTAIAPGIGTVIGGAAGGILGGIGGFFGGGFLGAGERGRARMFDQERYNKMSLAEMMQNREQIEAALIAQDPTKRIARKAFTGDLDRMVNLQRRTGLRTDEEMYGRRDQMGQLMFGGINPLTGQPTKTKGFLQTQMERGQQFGGRLLERQVIENQVKALQQAGGQTNTMQLAGFGGAVERQMGVTNAAQIMGRISGQGGLGAQATEDAYKRLMIEAVKMGVDISKMPQEMERMTQMTAQLATAGGGFSKLAVETAGMGIGGLSKGEIQAAGGAFQEFQQTAKEAAGYEGQLGMGFLLGKQGEKAFGKDVIKKIRSDHKTMTLLNQLTAEDLERDPDLLRGMAKDLNMSEDKLVKAVGQMNVVKQTRTEEEEEAAKEYGKAKKAGEDTSSAYYQFTKERAATRGKQFTQKGTFGRKAIINMIAGREAGPAEEWQGIPMAMTPEQQRAQEAQQVFGKQMGARITGAAGEAELESRARGDLARLDAIREHIQGFEKAAEMVSGNTVKFNAVFEAINNALEANGGKMTKELEKLADQLEQMSLTMAQQGFISTKPSE